VNDRLLRQGKIPSANGQAVPEPIWGAKSQEKQKMAEQSPYVSKSARKQVILVDISGRDGPGNSLAG
jgi:hypothetical protein